MIRQRANGFWHKRIEGAPAHHRSTDHFLIPEHAQVYPKNSDKHLTI
jgi:hypothetical protein